MAFTPTSIGRNEAAQGAVRYARQRFDAAGLFMQWLVEHVSDQVEHSRITVTLTSEPPFAPGIRLEVRRDAGRQVRVYRWEIARLNRLLETEPRGELLREEIRVTLKDIQTDGAI